MHNYLIYAEILIFWPPCKHLLIALIDFKFVELGGIIMIL